MIKTFGKSSDFLLSIISKEQNSNYGCISLIICEQVVLSSQEGNLSFLCVDLECLENAKPKRFQNDFFWSISNEEIIKYWGSYSDPATSSITPNITFDLFDDLFFQSYIPFKSDFFDEFIFVGFEDSENFRIKLWKKDNPHKISDFVVNDKDFFDVAKSTSIFLREILH